MFSPAPVVDGALRLTSGGRHVRRKLEVRLIADPPAGRDLTAAEEQDRLLRLLSPTA